jgi:GNAT superfamily N-acetyltransferase
MKITIAPLAKRDLAAADRIFRLAFGTFIGLGDPMSFMAGADLANPRWLADPSAVLGAYSDGELVGSNFVTGWGSFGVFGPLTVRPDLWEKGIGKRLLEATMELFARLGTRQEGLFTFPHSPKHIALYQKFDFWPQALTAVMSKPIVRQSASVRCARYSGMHPSEHAMILARCSQLTGAIFPGLDVAREIRIVGEQRLGDTILIGENGALEGFAVVHVGPGSEAEPGTAYIKFGAVRPGNDAPEVFDHLLAASEALAADSGARHLVAGVNTARHPAYRMLAERGFRTFLTGLAMLRPNGVGYNRPDCFVLDDWR